MPHVSQILALTWLEVAVVTVQLHTGHFVLTGEGPNWLDIATVGWVTITVVVVLEAAEKHRVVVTADLLALSIFRQEDSTALLYLPCFIQGLKQCAETSFRSQCSISFYNRE